MATTSCPAAVNAAQMREPMKTGGAGQEHPHGAVSSRPGIDDINEGQTRLRRPAFEHCSPSTR